MSLFGRRKPGFAKEVVLKPEDISGEFSDRNDPARQDANPKDEKVDMAARAQAVIDGTAVSAAEAIPQDLSSFLSFANSTAVSGIVHSAAAPAIST